MSCLNCQHSYRGDDTILHCHKGHMTMVSQCNCNDYQVFVKDKEELIRALERAIYMVKGLE